jgi:hypothetical protein
LELLELHFSFFDLLGFGDGGSGGHRLILWHVAREQRRRGGDGRRAAGPYRQRRWCTAGAKAPSWPPQPAECKRARSCSVCWERSVTSCATVSKSRPAIAEAVARARVGGWVFVGAGEEPGSEYQIVMNWLGLRGKCGGTRGFAQGGRVPAVGLFTHGRARGGSLLSCLTQTHPPLLI